MRYALVSDVHANVHAWDAVLVDLIARKAGHIICLGDIVGYGAAPAELLRSIGRNADTFVLGNHDAAACGLLDPAVFQGAAADVLRWTENTLDRGDREFLKNLPLRVEGIDGDPQPR